MQALQCLADQPGQAPYIAQLIAQRIGDEPTHRGNRLGLPLLYRSIRQLAPRGTQDPFKLVDRGLSVGNGMMYFCDVGDTAVCQPLDHPQIPQGPRAIEWIRGNLRDHLVELAGAAGCRRGETVHMEIDVEFRILDGHRMMQTERNPDDAASEARHIVKAGADRLLDFAECRNPFPRWPAHQDLQRAHRRGLRFLVEEIRILAAKPQHGCPGCALKTAYFCRLPCCRLPFANSRSGRPQRGRPNTPASAPRRGHR